MKGKNLQSYNFLNITKNNIKENNVIFNFPTDSQNRTFNKNYSYNIYPNKELDKLNNNKNIINYIKVGDYLLSTKTSSNNKVNSFKLTVNDKPQLLLKKYNNNYLPILMYMKKPRTINENITIPIDLQYLDNDKIFVSNQSGLISENNLLQLELKKTLNENDPTEFFNISCSKDNLTISSSDIDNKTNLKYIFIYLYKNDLKKKTDTNDLLLYSILTESSTIQTTINASKITGFNFSNDDEKPLKINFFLPYNFNFFYRTVNNPYNITESKTNSSISHKKYNFRRRFIYLISNSTGLIFYFYNPTQKRFLEENTNTLIPITLKYELSDSNFYHIKQEKIIIITNSTTLDKNITIYPLINESGAEIENVEYSILLYNSSLTEEEIDSLDNPPSPLLEITKYTKNDDGSMSFIINKNNIDVIICKLTAKAIVNEDEDEIVNYNIYSINMESNNNDNDNNNNDNNNNANANNYFVKKDNGKKSKWWIALIVIGILLIIIIVVVICLKMKKEKNANENNKNMNNTNDGILEIRNDTQGKLNTNN